MAVKGVMRAAQAAIALEIGTSCEDSEPENVEMSVLGVESSNALGR